MWRISLQCVILNIALHNLSAYTRIGTCVPDIQIHTGRRVVSEQFARQAEEFFSASNVGRIPDNVQSIVEDGVAKSRAAYLKINSTAKENLKALDDAMTSAYAGVKTIGEKVLLNTEANTKAAFDAAQSISRAKTFPEVFRLQSSFLQKQVVDATAQTNEFYELLTKVAQQTFEALNSAFTRNFDQLKKIG